MSFLKRERRVKTPEEGEHYQEEYEKEYHSQRKRGLGQAAKEQAREDAAPRGSSIVGVGTKILSGVGTFMGGGGGARGRRRLRGPRPELIFGGGFGRGGSRGRGSSNALDIFGGYQAPRRTYGRRGGTSRGGITINLGSQAIKRQSKHRTYRAGGSDMFGFGYQQPQHRTRRSGTPNQSGITINIGNGKRTKRRHRTPRQSGGIQWI